MQFHFVRSAPHALCAIPADNQPGPLGLLVGTIGVTALPFPVLGSVLIFLPEARTRPRTEFLGAEHRDWPWRLVMENLAAVLARLAPFTTGPLRMVDAASLNALQPRPTRIRAAPIGARPCWNYALLLVANLTMDDDRHKPIILHPRPQVKGQFSKLHRKALRAHQ